MEQQTTQMTNGQDRPDEPTAIDLGRRLLTDWEAAQPDNYFAADVNLQRALEFHWGQPQYARHARRLYHFGHVLATEVDAAVRDVNQDLNLPRLERFDALGRRIEEVRFHPRHDEAGRAIYASGLMSVYGERASNLLALALFYLSSQNGEAGHNCPVACTAGSIKALQAVGSTALQETYLPRLLDPDYDTHYTAAQFLTEVQGGSDVGANATVARPLSADEGTWLLSGEKWFCSNVTAEVALVTARVSDQGAGTRGLGLFLVPRRRPDGELNGFQIRRLKDKLGTRSMATGELEFNDALAFQVGPVEHGFKNVMAYVINTSRLYNAVGVSGNARRALLIAQTYAQYRTAFGQQVIRFPLVQAILANMRADTVAMLSGTLHIARLMDEVETAETGSSAADFLRVAINLNKYRTAVLGHDVIVRAIELLGGNGAIETFSVLPRLLRDNVVYENWEGTHNVLLAQVQRDMRRYGLQAAFFEAVSGLFSGTQDETLRAAGLEHLGQCEAELAEVLAMDELTAAIYFRPLMDRLTDLYYVACLGVEGSWELAEKDDRTKLRLAGLFLSRRVAGLEPKDIPYYDDLVSRLCQ